MLALPSLAAEGDFAKTLTPEEIKSAGLPKLTPQEMASLEALVERYRAGQPAVAAKPHDEAPAATPASATNAAKPKKIVPEWVGALITLQRTGNKPDKAADTLESRIAGEFDGWSGRTNFKLENGQIWTQVNKDDSYVYTPALKSPKVKITPAAFGTFWLEIEGVSQRLRIRPVRLE